MGPASADVHPTTARVTYRGRVMSRAAAICSMAPSGQVGMGVSCGWRADGGQLYLLYYDKHIPAGGMEGVREGGNASLMESHPP